ncbi:polygalacturonate 4-alpha-galacturonosyltransferase [Salvia divinorum]|uniref:Polygalacturonate 4-alpha-galacturonosyltransferase n=1 Tax=Salvia divinorum TaxID=28513 RepID=A0ABD1GXZ1_SALDI
MCGNKSMFVELDESECSSFKATGNDTNGYPVPTDLPEPVKKTSGSLDRDKVRGETIAVVESEMICELKFGSYYFWRREQREKMEDGFVKRMKHLLFVARAYYPSIAKLPKFDKLMKQNIQDFERVLSETTTDKDLPPQLEPLCHFSNNVLASSVAINSTVSQAQGSEKLVFHLLTDKKNIFAMKLGFFRNKYGDAVVQVLNVEDLRLYNHHKAAPLHLSMPEEFHSLEKVVVLGDGVIVQRDLSALWNLVMAESLMKILVPGHLV